MVSSVSNSIDADTLEIVIPRDEGHNTRTQKPSNLNLKVFVSVRGWTLQNGSVVNLLSTIAAGTVKRKTLAKHLECFVEEHGFDGVDLHFHFLFHVCTAPCCIPSSSLLILAA